VTRPPDDDGYRLWLRYDQLQNQQRRAEYAEQFRCLVRSAQSPILAAAQHELELGLPGLLGRPLPVETDVARPGALLIGTPSGSPVVASLELRRELDQLGPEGFCIASRELRGQPCTVIAANTDVGVLYGVFQLLRQLQTERAVPDLWRSSRPRIQRRLLNHWDNLDRSVERGYAGFSLWDWHRLPGYVSPQYVDYARANASLGINGTVLTNVNANARILTARYLRKVAALADVFRPYGLRVYLTARFSAPVELDGLTTADPLDPAVARWWRAKAAEIYDYVPDFGGFLVKANSEGQPGPHDYGRTHADGANMLADALAEHDGIVIWRAFVYDQHVPEDRAKQAYTELVPQDGQFRPNAVLQVKNGPIDFQPREPFHPLFGAMPKTPLFAEFQITQEYLGFSTHLAYLGPLFEETLAADTYVRGPGSFVAKVVDGSLDGHACSGMAGVTNIGTDRNWCGHPFGAANWFAFGRLAWDPGAGSAGLADEWLRMTFGNDPRLLEPLKKIMLESREAVVDYMTPLGLHHLMAEGHHYGPGPWLSEGRADWTSVYYHRADRDGIGFDRTPSGSNAVGLYAEPLRSTWSKLETCPESLLLWFHHVSWSRVLESGRSLWEELCHRYQAGVLGVREMQASWHSLAELIDDQRHTQVAQLLAVQASEACWWRDACVAYFQSFAKLPLPDGYPAPAATLAEYIAVRHYYVPGI
jgi:alpha-glucuronidase